MESTVSYLPHVAMVAVQLALGALNVVSKLTMASGMSPYVLITYRNLIAAIFLVPFAFFFERKSWSSISRKTVQKIFSCSIVGYSTSWVSSTAAAGAVLCVMGSLVMTFYRGPLVRTLASPIHWSYVQRTMAAEASNNAGGSVAVLGAALVVASNIAWAVWFIMQKKMSRSFASPYTSTMLIASMASVQCGVIGVVAEQRPSAWALVFDIRLVGSLYAGLVASGMVIAVMSWCIQVRGPVFVSMFSPMMLIVVAVVGWATLGEKIRAGSVVGALLIVVGLYTVLWGKGRDLVVVHTETSAAAAAADEEAMNRAVAGETPTATRTMSVRRDKDSCRCMCPYLLF